MKWGDRAAGAAWLVSIGLAWLAPLRAEAQSDYAGSYIGSPARIEAEVSTWGADCGVRPQSYTASERPAVAVRRQGAHLSVMFPDHTLRTNACWSPNPAMRLTSTAAADDRWRTECRTPGGEAKKESGRYTVTASSPLTLELLEESHYDWQLRESHCVAKVRITQRLERHATQPANAAQAKPDRTECTPGPLARLRLRPSEARIAPGERLCFETRAYDKHGCPSDTSQHALAWELRKPSAARGTLTDGCFKAAEAAAAGEGTFQVVAQLDGIRAQAEVVVAAPDLSDITARRSAASLPVAQTGPAIGDGLAGTGVKAVGVDSDRRLLWLVLGALGVVISSGGVALWLWRRSPPGTQSPPSRAASDPPPPAESTVWTAESAPRPDRDAPTPSASMPVAVGEQWICPTCRAGYAPGTARCAQDRDVLVPYATFVRQAKQAEVLATTCAQCGSDVATGATFCGMCGEKLVP